VVNKRREGGRGNKEIQNWGKREIREREMREREKEKEGEK